MAFQPGQSGNPNGRPAGSSDQTKRIRRLLGPHVAQLAEERLADALSGDKAAADAVLGFYAATAK